MSELAPEEIGAFIPLALKDAPALIEAVFPAQKVSFEAQKERKAGNGQTLTALGSYWKGRKPLILVRAIVLGSLLPQTKDAEQDLEIFEKLMAFDDEGLAKRAMIHKKIKPKEIAARIKLDDPWRFFKAKRTVQGLTVEEIHNWKFPLDTDAAGITISWRSNLDETERIRLYGKALDTFPSYEAKSEQCKRPEELDQVWLYESIWPAVNRHYAYLGVKVNSHAELIEKLGILRYGHRPRVGDSFSGGGSIPFEAARLGCDVYASDLNPIACLLTWGALNVIGASTESRSEIEQAQSKLAKKVDHKISQLGIEHDSNGNRAKVFFYCLETRCPETGWLVPMAASWVISKSRNVVARLIPDHKNRRFDIDVVTGVSAEELAAAATGTVRDGTLIYSLDGKTYHTAIKTLRGDYYDTDGNLINRVRRWEKCDFRPRSSDIFQERLYCIQWVKKDTFRKSRKETFFAGVTEEDLERERKVDAIVSENLEQWQKESLVADMIIEPGGPPRYQGKSLITNLGWQYWHQAFTARDLLSMSLIKGHPLQKCRYANSTGRMVTWNSGVGKEYISNVFSDQALNSFYNYGSRCFWNLWNSACSFNLGQSTIRGIDSKKVIANIDATRLDSVSDLWITDPPYADAVMYHEITEFFIAWLRKNPPRPFDQWTWDSRRALAIKGSGDAFRRGMVDAYSAMTKHMPDNGMQCVMFTHQDTGVWSDMVGIFWAAGLQVVAAWYIATETTSELKKGGYVQGTVILMLRKRTAGDKSGFKQRVLPAVRNEVKAQIEQMMHLNEEVEGKLGEPVFNDSDLQMAGYAAALKVLTAYTAIGGEDVTAFALRPRRKGEVTVVDEIVQQAAEAANSLLVPEGLSADVWQRISGIQRFYLRMMDMETSGASKLDNYQNFAKAFRVEDYTKVMGNMTANKARLKGIQEFVSRDLSDSTEFGATWLGRLAIGLQQLLADSEPQVVVSQLQAELPDFMEIRPVLIDLLHFIQFKSPDEAVRNVAEVLGNRLSNLRALGQ